MLPLPFSPLLKRTGMLLERRSPVDLMPTRRGEPRRVATSCPGKLVDLKARAKAPSCNQSIHHYDWLTMNPLVS